MYLAQKTHWVTYGGGHNNEFSPCPVLWHYTIASCHTVTTVVLFAFFMGKKYILPSYHYAGPCIIQLKVYSVLPSLALFSRLQDSCHCSRHHFHIQRGTKWGKGTRHCCPLFLCKSKATPETHSRTHLAPMCQPQHVGGCECAVFSWAFAALNK